MNEKTKKLVHAAFYLLVFSFLFLWFSKIHALVVYDGDDWTYLSYIRRATPDLREWNPAKVFPEMLFPFFSTFAVYVLMPIIGDYISAQTLMHAFVVSLFVTGYLWSFSCMMRRSFSLSRLTASVIALLFLVFHFLAMRSGEYGNQYLLYCLNLNCYYNYLLPSLLNASIVMSLMANEKMQAFLKDGAPTVKGCFYVVVYLAIFSNLTCSGILASYAGAVLLLDMIRRWKQKQWSRCFKKNAFFLGVLIAWLISAVYELNGSRAGNASFGAYKAYLSCKNLIFAILGCNRAFLLWISVFALADCILLLCGRRKDDTRHQLITLGGVSLIALAACCIYMILLCAVVNPDCLFRSEYLFSIFFYAVLIAMLALAYLVSRYLKLMLALPLLVLFLISEVNTWDRTFLESNFSDAPTSLCAEISRDLIAQLQEADRNGLTETTLRVPVHVADPENESNWPHSLFLMKRIPKTLYAHGLISREIDVTPVADPDVNAKYHLPVPWE